MRQLTAVTAVDAAYVGYLAVLLASIASSRDTGTEISIVVLHPDVNEDAQRRLADLAPGVRVEWRQVHEADLRRFGPSASAFLLARPQYFRCLAGTLLPDELSRSIYLDADTMVLGDLGQLWDVDLAGHPVGAVVDFLPTAADAIVDHGRFGMSADTPYLNSGVLLVDLDRWRRLDIGGRAIAACLAFPGHRLAHGRWPQHDQFGLNIVLRGDWFVLEPKWNQFAERPADDAVIVHFVGNGKPGNEKCSPRYRKLFMETLASTGWSIEPPV